MAFFDTKASISKFFFLSGLSLASFSLFLHPMDPLKFLEQIVFHPLESLQAMYGYIQMIAFWVSAGLMSMGVVGMLAVVIQRWRAKQFFSRINNQHPGSDDGEENWMFL